MKRFLAAAPPGRDDATRFRQTMKAVAAVCVIRGGAPVARDRPRRIGLTIAHQTSGDMLRWNPHFHAIVLEGGFDEHGRFFYLPFNGLQAMVELFRRRVIKCRSAWRRRPDAHRKGPTGREACRQSLELETLRVQYRQQRPYSGPSSAAESCRVHLTSTFLTLLSSSPN